MALENINENVLIKAWLCALRVNGLGVIQLGDPAVHMALNSVADVIDKEIKPETKDQYNDRSINDWYSSLVRLRNLFYRDDNGGYSALERHLRSLQVSSVEHPNPYYEEFRIFLSEPNAKSLLMELPEYLQKLVNRLSNTFIDIRKKYI